MPRTQGIFNFAVIKTILPETLQKLVCRPYYFLTVPPGGKVSENRNHHLIINSKISAKYYIEMQQIYGIITKYIIQWVQIDALPMRHIIPCVTNIYKEVNLDPFRRIWSQIFCIRFQLWDSIIMIHSSKIGPYHLK